MYRGGPIQLDSTPGCTLLHLNPRQYTCKTHRYTPGVDCLLRKNPGYSVLGRQCRPMLRLMSPPKSCCASVVDMLKSNQPSPKPLPRSRSTNSNPPSRLSEVESEPSPYMLLRGASRLTPNRDPARGHVGAMVAVHKKRRVPHPEAGSSTDQVPLAAAEIDDEPVSSRTRSSSRK